MRDFDLLSSYRPAAPTDAEMRLARHVAWFAVNVCGVVLPRFTVEWYRGAEAERTDGFTWKHARPVRVQLRVGLPPRRLVAVALHEYWHVVDAEHPGSRFLGVPELEARAERFETEWTPAACRLLGVRC